MIIKQPSEDRLYDIDCGAAGLRPDESITGIIDIASIALDERGGEVPTVAPLDFPGSSAISGHVIQMRISGGVEGWTYKVTIRFSTVESPVCEVDFYVQVVDV